MAHHMDTHVEPYSLSDSSVRDLSFIFPAAMATQHSEWTMWFSDCGGIWRQRSAGIRQLESLFRLTAVTRAAGGHRLRHKLGPRAFPVFPVCKGVGLLWSVGGGVTEICLHLCESWCPYCITVSYLGYEMELVFSHVLHNGEKINLVSLTI